MIKLTKEDYQNILKAINSQLSLDKAAKLKLELKQDNGDYGDTPELEDAYLTTQIDSLKAEITTYDKIKGKINLILESYKK